MFFKCFHELSAALSRNSYQGKVLQQQLKVFSQMFYLRPIQQKQKVTARNTATTVCMPRFIQKQHLCMNGFIPIKLYELVVGGESIYKNNPASMRAFLCTDHLHCQFQVLQDTAKGNIFPKPVLNVFTKHYK